MVAEDGLLQVSDAFDALCLELEGVLGAAGAAGRGEAVHNGRNRRTPAATIQGEKCMAKQGEMPKYSTGTGLKINRSFGIRHPDMDRKRMSRRIGEMNEQLKCNARCASCRS